MNEDDIKKELEDGLPEEAEPDQPDPFAVDGLGHTPVPEDDRGGGGE